MTFTRKPEGVIPRDPNLAVKMTPKKVPVETSEPPPPAPEVPCSPFFQALEFNGQSLLDSLPNSNPGQFFALPTSQPFGLLVTVIGETCNQVTWNVSHGSAYDPPLIVQQTSDSQLLLAWLPGAVGSHTDSDFTPIVIQAQLDGENFGDPLTLEHQ